MYRSTIVLICPRVCKLFTHHKIPWRASIFPSSNLSRVCNIKLAMEQYFFVFIGDVLMTGEVYLDYAQAQNVTPSHIRIYRAFLEDTALLMLTPTEQSPNPKWPNFVVFPSQTVIYVMCPTDFVRTILFYKLGI